MRRALVLLTMLGATTAQADDNAINDVRGSRLGVSLLAGARAPFPALEFGGELRAGVQVTQIFSLYGTIGGQVALAPSPSTTTLSGAFTASILAEVFLFERLFLAIGPGAGWGQLVVPDAKIIGEQLGTVTANGAKALADVRIGVTLPLKGWPKNSGISLALNGQVMFHPNATVRLNPEPGIPEQPTQQRLAVTYTPMFMVGVDWR